MLSEGVDGIVGARQFRLAERGMDFPVANVMQQYSGPAFAAFQLGDQVMQALWHPGRNGPATERAGRNVVLCILSHRRKNVTPEG